MQSLPLMASIIRLLKKFLSDRKSKESAAAEALRIEFKTRYHHFKLLLNANNRALENIAAIEGALQGSDPFDMYFVRKTATAVSAEVYRMIRNLDELTPGRYRVLHERFQIVQQSIDRLLTEKKRPQDARLIIPLAEIGSDMSALVGNKMAQLGEIKNKIGILTPDGFAITAAAHQRFFEYNRLQIEIDRRFQSTRMRDIESASHVSQGVQTLIKNSEIPPDVQDCILTGYRTLMKDCPPGTRVAMRSSAMGEDVAGQSFAGQYHSALNVDTDNILKAYKAVVASKYALPAITYRYTRGLKDEDLFMGVGCLVMIDARAGGVVYTHDPVDDENDVILINSVWGLPKAVVDGRTACDLLVLSKSPPLKVVQTQLGTKEQQVSCSPLKGIRTVGVEDKKQMETSIDADQAITLGELALRMDHYYGGYQDVEWAIDHEGRILILQCRPMQIPLSPPIESPRPAEKEKNQVVLFAGGITASPGIAAGNVFKITRGTELSEFPEGAVLVIRQALPRWAVVLHRAVAVISEQGGFAGHLATVAREFGIPAIFCVQGAMDRLHTGDAVTLDTNHHKIYSGILEFTSTKTAKKKNMMAESPVFNTLKRLSQHIVTLNLLDPDDPRFCSQHCQTMHDITRFIHEKSVKELFSFGKKYNYAERFSKQLFVDTPLSWRVLNLDDGFRSEVADRYIRLEDIVSIPMRALWEGIAAVPWQGPPPTDGKGFVSVMFQSTAKPSLVVGGGSRFGNRNYFMISKNFCTMMSQLGYHFSTVETVISKDRQENYITFQFKGGAADFSRRLKRIYFIRDILEDYDFTVEIQEDILRSRLEGFETDFMESRLKIIGYLMIHTRQLDMIMLNATAVNHYRSKFKADLAQILNQTPKL